MPQNGNQQQNQQQQQSQRLQPDVIQPQVPINPSKSHMFQINFYRKFFDLDSEQFFQKLQQALNPLNKSSSPTNYNHEDDDEEVTELFGFIWITGTLIFLMFVSATGSNILSDWLHPTKEQKKYEYDFSLLTKSISLFYGYNILVPGALFTLTTWVFKFPHRLSLTKLISIYGYTNILWFPITFINVLIVIFISNENHHKLLNALEWIIVLTSGAVTGLSNLSKISPIVKKNTLLLSEGNTDKSRAQHIAIIIILALAHIGFSIAVKISFFGIKV